MNKDQKDPRVPLTERQREVLEFIRKYLQKHGFGPTVRELAKGMGIHSPNGVMGHLEALERKGFIKRQANLSRSISLTVSASPRNDGLPVAALLENGRLVENPDPQERVDLYEKIGADGLDFSWIRIQTDFVFGDLSLKKGDLLLLRRSRNASEGESVIIRNFGKEFLLAKCLKNGSTGQTVLETAERRLENSRSNVLGILVAVIRFTF